MSPFAIVGTTASGKSALAMAIARHRAGVELVSVDSMQLYRGMDIGTAKPTAAEQAEVPHHLIDVVDPDEEYSITRFRAAAEAAVADVVARGGRPVLVGGTGLYLRAVVDRLTPAGRYPEVVAELEREPDTRVLFARLQAVDPVAAAKMEPTNRRRVVRALEVTLGTGVPFSTVGPGLDAYPPTPYRLVGVRLDRRIVAARIRARYAEQLAAGFLDEVRALAARPQGLSRTARQALGYRQFLDHLAGTCTLAEATEAAVVATVRFAKRQERWFRRDPRIVWCAPPPGEEENPMAVLPELLRHFDTCN